MGHRCSPTRARPTAADRLRGWIRIRGACYSSVMRRILLLSLFLVGCQSPPQGSGWIVWDPPDPVRVEELKKAVADRAGNDPAPITLDELLESDPLSAVPDERFCAAFPQLKPSDA